MINILHKMRTTIVCLGEFDWETKFLDYFAKTKGSSQLLGGKYDKHVTKMALHHSGYLSEYWENPRTKLGVFVLSEKYYDMNQSRLKQIVIDQKDELIPYTE